MTKKNKTLNFKKNIEIKVDSKKGIAKGNLFKQKIITNNATVKAGNTFSGKINFANTKSKKN